jgi:hypothetical protein
MNWPRVALRVTGYQPTLENEGTQIELKLCVCEICRYFARVLIPSHSMIDFLTSASSLKTLNPTFGHENIYKIIVVLLLGSGVL